MKKIKNHWNNVIEKVKRRGIDLNHTYCPILFIAGEMRLPNPRSIKY